MKKTIITAAMSLFAAFAISCGSNNGKNKLVVEGDESKFDTLSYVIGVDFSNSLGRDFSNITFSHDLLKKGMSTILLGGDEVTVEGKEINLETISEILPEFFNNYRQRTMTLMQNERAKTDSTIQAVPAEQLGFNPETMFVDDKECAIVSAALGVDVGNTLLKRNLPLHTIWLFKAMDDAKAGSARMNNEEVNSFLRHYYSVVVPTNNRKASEEWLSGIENTSGVNKTASGLLYKIEEAGNMDKKAESDTAVVRVHYKGTLRDGKVFDASRFEDMPEARRQMLKQYRPNDYDKNEPVEFPLNRVIKGWTEGLQLVGEGGKITLWVPSELAYGERGAGQDIGPNEALRFDVEIVEVNPVKADAETK
ncbi:MAG: FKBP-type peptidyl-prolyl cis-trans isomerase [Bacteroidaceae bacterium]|nr:FKBP-type peptidyl-prolyl cis-trans isomerase [Bacteroidaceae bacterium]